MSEEEKKPGQLVELPLKGEEHQRFVVEIAENFLEKARGGKVKNVAIIWDEDSDRNLKCSMSAGNRWTLSGMIWQALVKLTVDNS